MDARSNERYAAVARLLEQSELIGGDARGRTGKPADAPGASPLLVTTAANQPLTIYRSSIRYHDGVLFAAARTGMESFVLVASGEDSLGEGIGAPEYRSAHTSVSLLPVDWESYRLLASRFGWVAPRSLKEEQTTIGMGDRLGLATPGHIDAIVPFRAAPVLAQQSIRELTLTGRNYRQVVADAAFGVFQSGFEQGYGADGDHLKNLVDIDTALDAGMPMITLDLTEVMDPAPAEWPESKLEEAFEALPEETRRIVEREAIGRRFDLGDAEVVISRLEALTCTLMYWKALDFTETVDAYLRKHRGEAYDLEVSIDETTAPTVPSHHLFIARELVRRGVGVSSLAPRFIGEFQKGIDYIGDVAEFERQFVVHSGIAREFGGYKVSIHSGSDKFSVYPAIGRHTAHRVHVKTAGTSWLCAIQTIAQMEPSLYRSMHAAAFDYFDEATRLYHITADLSRIPALDSVSDDELPALLEQNETRQLIHISYGGLLHQGEIRERFFNSLARHERRHYENLSAHLGRHISTLGVPRHDA